MIVTDLPRSKGSPVSPLCKGELAQFVADAAKAVGLTGEVSVLLTGDRRIRELNREFRGKDEATDVLSFPALKGFGADSQCGDLAISLETALRQAEEYKHSLDTEIRVLMLHGLLHLAGYDHEADTGEMARRERRLRKQFGLPPGLVERTGLAAMAGGGVQKSTRQTSRRLRSGTP